MRILVTGGAGFIGSHVVDAFVTAGHEVWVLDDLSRGKRERVNPQARFTRMDLRSPDLKDFLAEGSFECINHHAAQIDVRVSIADPIRDATVNILGTLRLLEAACAVGVPRFIFASTGGAIYGEQRHFPATEQHPTIPLSPHGVAKLSIERYLEYYRQVHGLQYAVLRYANVYGPRQDPEGETGVIAIFCGRILRGQRVIIYGDGEQTRDYVYVGDVARVNLLALRYLAGNMESLESMPLSQQTLAGSGQEQWDRRPAEPSNGRTAERPARSLPAACCRLSTESRDSTAQRLKKLNGLGTVFNIGTGIETSVNALAALLIEAADTDCPITHQPSRLGEQMRSVIDATRAQQDLGWRPAVPLSDGLLATLAWFRSQEAVAAGRQPFDRLRAGLFRA
jgi:UDP-glucose 4-epimerase